MFVVVFKARLKDLNPEAQRHYLHTAARLRELALGTYRCLNFVSANETGFEIALSYWRTLEDIQAWKNASEHLLAQSQGRQAWYRSYSVEVLEMQRQYHWDATDQEVLATESRE